MSRLAPRLLAASAALLAACAPALPGWSPAPVPAAGRVVADTVHSPALEGNRVGDSPSRGVQVYLPPGYDAERGRRYPAVYLLHGFAGDPGTWVGPRSFDVDAAMDSLLAAGAAREAIVVMPDARNAYGGSFYASSPVTGAWEDFAARDLVAHVDRRYRTLPGPGGRAVAGWSMGGYGALHLAARHPEVFGAAYALSPCCLGPEVLDDLGAREGVWRRAAELAGPPDARGDFMVALAVALAAVLSPAPDAPPPHVELPFALRDGALVETPAAARWRESDVPAFVARHAEGLRGLRALGFDAGTRDGFAHIPATVRRLARALEAAGIPHRFEEYDGTHGSHVRQRLRTHVLPLLTRALDAAR